MAAVKYGMSTSTNDAARNALACKCPIFQRRMDLGNPEDVFPEQKQRHEIEVEVGRAPPSPPRAANNHWLIHSSQSEAILDKF
ncbi:hypothetical protein N7535_009259 [Penicillium sp. DV-2018c]|nr:hypothetical protein N7535_009259 [Penicillium sp. DV-2018c]